MALIVSRAAPCKTLARLPRAPPTDTPPRIPSQLVDEGATDKADRTYWRTQLMWAAEEGHTEVNNLVQVKMKIKIPCPFAPPSVSLGQTSSPALAFDTNELIHCPALLSAYLPGYCMQVAKMLIDAGSGK